MVTLEPIAGASVPVSPTAPSAPPLLEEEEDDDDDEDDDDVLSSAPPSSDGGDEPSGSPLSVPDSSRPQPRSAIAKQAPRRKRTA